MQNLGFPAGEIGREDVALGRLHATSGPNSLGAKALANFVRRRPGRVGGGAGREVGVGGWGGGGGWRGRRGLMWLNEV